MNNYFTEKNELNAEVNQPNHYISNGIEVIDVIEAFTKDLKGIQASDTANLIKYACRWMNKGGIKDLKKIIVYANHLIDNVERNGLSNQPTIVKADKTVTVKEEKIPPTPSAKMKTTTTASPETMTRAKTRQ